VPWGKNRAYQIRSVDDHAKHVVDSDVSPLSFVLPTKAWFLFLLNTKTTHKDHVKLSQGRLPPLRITSLVQMVGTTDPGHLSVCYSGWQHLRYHTAEKARVTAPSLGSLFHVVGSYRGADLLAPEKGLRGGGRVGSGRRHLATAAQARDIPPTSSPPRPPPEASGPQRQPTVERRRLFRPPAHHRRTRSPRRGRTSFPRWRRQPGGRRARHIFAARGPGARRSSMADFFAAGRARAQLGLGGGGRGGMPVARRPPRRRPRMP